VTNFPFSSFSRSRAAAAESNKEITHLMGTVGTDFWEKRLGHFPRRQN
jgi:hypothetical protein